MKFSAVILAGGKSSRMGRDKALIEVGGQPLLARQLQLARDAGADEVFISGRAEVDYAAFNCPVLRDRLADAGPLAGIEAALNATATPLLLVLAVDMPHMSADWLRQLATHCTETVGAIPRVNGAIEPLAAFYPRTALRLLAELLDERLSLTPALSRWERESQSPSFCSSEAHPANPVVDSQEMRRTIPPLPAGEGRGENSPNTVPRFEPLNPSDGCKFGVPALAGPGSSRTRGDRLKPGLQAGVHGAGERPGKSPGAKQFAERCVAAGLATFVDLPLQDAHFFANWNSPADLPCLK